MENDTQNTVIENEKSLFHESPARPSEGQNTVSVRPSKIPIVLKSCKVCVAHSELRLFLENGKKSGTTLLDLCEEAKEKYDFSVSTATISRHLDHLHQYLARAGTDVFSNQLLEGYGEKIQELADVQGQLSVLITAMIQHFLNKIENYSPSIHDIVEISRLLEIELKNGKVSDSNPVENFLEKMEKDIQASRNVPLFDATTEVPRS